jgi:hypothetical protein
MVHTSSKEARGGLLCCRGRGSATSPCVGFFRCPNVKKRKMLSEVATTRTGEGGRGGLSGSGGRTSTPVLVRSMLSPARHHS